MPVAGSHRRRSILSCDDCGRKYKSERWLKLHKLTHQQKRVNGFSCSHAGSNKTLTKMSNVKVHQDSHKNEVHSILKKKRRRKENVLRYPCMFCNFRTLSRSHAERHMEVRHNARYKRNIKLVRAHADALEIQHHQMLLALEIQDSLVHNLDNGKPDLRNTYVPNDAGLITETSNVEILCAKCGYIFFVEKEYDNHDCDIPRDPEYPGNFKLKANINTPILSYEVSQEGIQSEFKVSQWSEPLIPLNSSGSIPVQSDHTVDLVPTADENGNLNNSSTMLTLLGRKSNSDHPVTSHYKDYEETATFTFQDLLILEQNLSPYYV